LVFLIIPLFQFQFQCLSVTPLRGAIVNPEDVSLSFEKWFSGEYQTKKETYLNATFGFRELFIRLNNQIAFSLFNKANVQDVVIGKNNYLYEINYIKAYYGLDYIGKDSIEQKMKKLSFISDTLAKLHKNIIIVFAAGKGSFYPEYFPDNKITQKGITNIKTHIEFAKKYGISYIDFNSYFIANKYKSKYPLYPQYGIHWSNYGMCVAADSIIKYIEKTRNIHMPHIYWKKVDLENAKETDYDIADGMNLKLKLKSFKMGYPQINIESDSGKTKPSVIVISDSFYWGMFNFGIGNTFKTSHFWYYNKQVFPESYQNPLETSQVDLRQQIALNDVIILMATEATLPKLGWGFIEKTYQMFKGNYVSPTNTIKQ
jgi:hypothetical protein